MFDIQAGITNRIIAELKKGNIPWQKPWLGALRHDKTMLVSASSRAQKAANLILGAGSQDAAPEAAEA